MEDLVGERDRPELLLVINHMTHQDIKVGRCIVIIYNWLVSTCMHVLRIRTMHIQRASRKKGTRQLLYE